MSWDYRICTSVSNGETFYEMGKVYFDEVGDETPGPASPGAFMPCGETEEELQWHLERMIEACEKAIADERARSTSGRPTLPRGPQHGAAVHPRMTQATTRREAKVRLLLDE